MTVLEIIKLILTEGHQIIVINDCDDMTPTQAIIHLAEEKLKTWHYVIEGNALLIY
jgi:hypothetical protein